MILLTMIFVFLSFADAYGGQSLDLQPQNSLQTCTISQKCKPPFANYSGPCLDPMETENPEISWSVPQKLKTMIARTKLDEICPFLNTSEPLCCNDDQAYIMHAKFQQLDTVFGNDVPICAVNLKKLWCEYTCSPQKYKFVNGTGYKEQTVTGSPRNLTMVTFSVDEDMACTLYRSCRGVSLIAQASIQSPKAFLDFMGVNGQNESLTIITFKFDPLSNGTSDVNGSSENFIGEPLSTQMYPCSQIIPENKTIDGYTRLKNAPCNFCKEICEKPKVDAHVGFFDGFKVAESYIILGAVTVFSFFYQLYIYFYKRPRVLREYQELVQNK